MLGFSIGGGSMVADCDGCDSQSGVAADAHLGGMINPNLAILWDGSVVAHTEQNLTLASTVSVGAIQYWIVPNVWLKGGLGFGRLSVSDDRSGTVAESDTAGAFLAAAGVELMQSGNFALDGSVRFATVAYDQANVTNASVNIGFNWY